MRSRKARYRATKPRLITLAAVALSGLVGVGTAQAASFSYVNTGSPMAANTAYFSAVLNHTGNQIASCQNPTFSAAIYLKTSGGTIIRRGDGNCPLFKTGHAQENSTRAWCWNKASTSKYAACTEYYN